MLTPDVLRLACPPVPTVRIGFVGLGNRGRATLERYMVIDGISIAALCDLIPANIDRAIDIACRDGRYHPLSFSGPGAWRQVVENPGLDLIYICTDWLTHTEIATHAMKCGKHVAIEVPAAVSVADCWRLVDTAESTRRHCFMLENCCYDPFALSTLVMQRRGLFGDITHCEGAYIHDLRDRYRADENAGGFQDGWISRYCGRHAGNPYPTHGLGPIAQLLGIHRGDRFEQLVSLSSRVPGDDSGVYINNTLINTARGRSILIQYDVTTPRPYSRLQTVCGTRGFAQKYPVQCVMLDGGEPLTGDRLDSFLAGHQHPFVDRYRADAERLGVPNIMNYIMDRRLIYCLRQGLPLDMDVYDAAEWSCITELSELSFRQGSRPVMIPDFTRGRWDIYKPDDIMW